MPSDVATVIRPGSGGRRSTSAAQALASAKKATRGLPRPGRPRTYSPALCEEAIALGMQGKTWAGIATSFNISRNTLNEWESQFPEFRDALSRARTAAQAYLEEHGRKNLKADRYQAQVWGKLIAVHEDYRDASGSNVNVTLDLGGAIAEIEARRRPSDAKPVEVASSFAPLADASKAKE